VAELEAAVRTVCEPIFNKPLAEISFGQVLLRLFDTARRFEMEVQPQLILLQKTLLNIEGLGRELYPQLDLFETAQPILRGWMTERLGGRAVLDDIRTQWPELRETLRELPTLVRRIGEQAANGELKVQMQDPAVAKLREEVARDARSRYYVTLGAIAAGAGAYLMAVPNSLPAEVAYAALAVSAVFLLLGRPRRPSQR
ncbi:MAG: ubiquinone biosynthesis regulatory protein kinase UbiB, partial [Pseudomonadota bacterium]